MDGAENQGQSIDGFQVDTWVHLLGGFVERHRKLWIRLGNMESRILSERLEEIRIEQPVYITGLARSGSTLLLELLNLHPELTAHRYRDYPMLFTPYLWNRYLDLVPEPDSEPVERTHRDGIFITPESPEAFEEMLWMAFFPDLHDPKQSAILDPGPRSLAFEKFYRAHIRKLLLVRGGRRYLSKGNYNITRLEYLLNLFGDARFVIPVREPVWHIASSIRQHRLFCRGEQGNPRAVAHLARAGHFEFGYDRRPINTGDGEVSKIMSLWDQKEEVEGWAGYWRLIHDYLSVRLENNPRLREAVMVVPYEELCRRPAETFRKLLDHCRLPAQEELIAAAVKQIRPPSFDLPEPLSPQDIVTIERYTAESAARFGLGRYAAEAPFPKSESIKNR
jgi:hypothetical protein